MAIIGKDGKTFSHDLFKVGDQECPNIPSYDIIVEEENMLYKHVKYDLVKSYK